MSWRARRNPQAYYRLLCHYCKIGMPFVGDQHHRPMQQFMECGTDDRYPCAALELRRAVQEDMRTQKSRTKMGTKRKG